MTNAPTPEGREVAIPLEQINGIALVWSILLLVVPLLIYAAVHGDFLGLIGSMGGSWQQFLWTLGLFFLLIVAHEGCHALGWKFAGGLPWSVMSFGMKWQTLTPYAHAKGEMRADAYRIGVILPLILTGVLPFLIALWVAHPTTAFIASVMISAAVGDLLVLWIMRGLPPDALVKDHPSKAGCIVVQE
ncbi:MAG: DUF3267 domain-containing protein, partial [Phototrophicaceae bacterium]|jgi:hypothetical protein